MEAIRDGLDPSGAKALALNLDHSIYGTIAEIGAGQEVARRFFAVGASSGTIAKTMSAYDMAFSDQIYGPAKRYVSRERLLGMLDHEYSLLIERLDESRGERTRFFSFANTVAARNFKGTNECHGWMGVRFQSSPWQAPSEIILHVRMLDTANILQQEALGLFGVNMIYGAYHFFDEPEQLIGSLADELGTERIEVDVIEFNGPVFADVDQRRSNLALLERKFTDALLIGPDARVKLASEMLRRKPVLLLRGSFRPVTMANVAMLEAGTRQFAEDADLDGNEPTIVLEVTIKNLLAHDIAGRSTILGITDSLAAMGHHVLITDYPEYFRLSKYLRRHTDEPIAILLGANNLFHLFDAKFYAGLEGGILEAFGRLFSHRVNMYVYPVAREPFESHFEARGIDLGELGIRAEALVTAENLQVYPDQQELYHYMLQSGLIRPITEYDIDPTRLYSSTVRAQLQDGNPAWKTAVPAAAAAVIEEQELFKRDD